MFINQCIASKSGILNNKVIDFSSRITIVEGANDSGKTLISRAIIDLIFSINDKSSILDQSTWDDFYLNCLFNFDGKTYKIIKNNNAITVFNIIKNEEKLIFDSSLDKELPPSINIFRYINSYNPLSYSLLGYMKTPFDSFPEIDTIKEISNFFLNDSSGYYNTFKLLQDHFTASGVNKNIENKLRNMILFHENEIKNIDKNLEISKLKEQKVKKIKSEKIALVNEKKILNLKTQSLRNNLKILEELHDLLNELQSKKEENDNLKTIISSEESKKNDFNIMKDELNKGFPQFVDLDNIQKDNFNIIEKLYSEIKELDENISTKTSNMEIRRKRIKKSLLFFLLLECLSAFVLYFQNYIEIIQLHLILSYSTIAFLAFLTILIPIFKLWKIRKNNLIPKMNDDKKIKHEEFINILESHSIDIKDMDLKEIYEFLLQYYEEYGFYTDKEEEIQKIEKSMKDKETISEYKQQVTSFKKEIDILKKTILKKINEIGLYTESDIENYPIDQAKSFYFDEISECENEMSKIDDLISQIDNELDNKEKQDTDIQNTYKTIDDHKSKLELLEKYQSNILSIISIFEKSIENRGEFLFKDLTQKTLRNFNIITSNQYQSIINHENTGECLKTGIFPSSDNKSLSSIVYLSFKIAATDFLNNYNLPIPLIIDEPGIYLDQNRLANLKSILSEISTKRQVIIFTHDKSAFSNFGKQVSI